MRVMVALENRFLKSSDGNIYSTTVCDYHFWQRYLQVFDEVVVCARVQNVNETFAGKIPANGPGVTFHEIPMYIGPKQYAANYCAVKRRIREATTAADRFILRIPGTLGTLLWKQLKKKHLPYGVEVVGDPLDAMNTAGVNPLLKAYLKRHSPAVQRRQCRDAVASAYVTQFHLQKIYPPGEWATYYSSISLPDEAIVSSQQIEQNRLLREEAVRGKRPFRICHAGTMSAKYKAQDILIQAVAQCRRNGLNIELALMGDGQHRAYYESVAKEAGIHEAVWFLGKLKPGKPVRDEMDRSDIFVFPSLTEGLPRVLIEAMARGLPCIASDVGGISELLGPDFLVEPGDVQQLASKIEMLLADLQKMSQVSVANVQKSCEYKYEILNHRRKMFYEKVAEGVNPVK